MQITSDHPAESQGQVQKYQGADKQARLIDMIGHVCCKLTFHVHGSRRRRPEGRAHTSRQTAASCRLC